MNNSIITTNDYIIETKTCITCHVELPICDFGKRRYRSNKPDGHWIFTRYGECLKCASIRKAKWRKLHPCYMHNYYLKRKKLIE